MHSSDVRRHTREIITSPRLVLEPLELEHAELMVDVLADEDLYAFTGGHPPTAAELTERYRRQIEGSGADHEVWANWIIVDSTTQNPVGFVQATLLREERGWAADVAWVVGTRFQGQGIAGEAAVELVRHLEAGGVTRFTAHIADGHLASLAVARRIGLARTDLVDEAGERLHVRG